MLIREKTYFREKQLFQPSKIPIIRDFALILCLIYCLFLVNYHGIGRLVASVENMIMKMNFFRTESSISRIENADQIALISSRIYIVLLVLTLLVLALLDGLNQTTISITVSSPTVATIEQLQDAYPNRFSCPCMQIAVPYSTFLSITASYHQVSFVI